MVNTKGWLFSNTNAKWACASLQTNNHPFLFFDILWYIYYILLYLNVKPCKTCKPMNKELENVPAQVVEGRCLEEFGAHEPDCFLVRELVPPFDRSRWAPSKSESTKAQVKLKPQSRGPYVLRWKLQSPSTKHNFSPKPFEQAVKEKGLNMWNHSMGIPHVAACPWNNYPWTPHNSTPLSWPIAPWTLYTPHKLKADHLKFEAS